MYSFSFISSFAWLYSCSFSSVVGEAGVPFVTTSVNLSGGAFAREISEVPSEILEWVDVVVDASRLDGRPSTLIVDGKGVKR